MDGTDGRNGKWAGCAGVKTLPFGLYSHFVWSKGQGRSRVIVKLGRIREQQVESGSAQHEGQSIKHED